MHGQTKIKFKAVLVLSFGSESGPGPSAYSRAFCFRTPTRMLSVELLIMRVQQLKNTFSIIVRRNSRVFFSIFGLGANDLSLETSIFHCILFVFSHLICLFFSLVFFLSFAVCWFLDISCLFLLCFPSLLSSLLFSFLTVIACVDSKAHVHSSVSGCVPIRDTSLVEGLVYGLQFLCEEATMEDERAFSEWGRVVRQTWARDMFILWGGAKRG